MSLIISILVIIKGYKNMIIKGQNHYKYHIKYLLDKMKDLNKIREKFIEEIFCLFLSIKGKHNFLQFARYSKYIEQRFRQQFEKPFDFLDFNKNLVLTHGGNEHIIAIDPSYIKKSGKHTPGSGYFWSGVAGKAKWGLEITGIASVDLDNHTAFHLEAVQTLVDSEQTNLLEHYTDIIVQRKNQLQDISKYIVADAFFSKKTFVDKLVNNGFEVTSRFRKDAFLQYLYKGEQKKGRGRPRKYDGKVDFNHLNMEHFKLIEQTDKLEIYHAIVYSKSLKRNINLVIERTKNNSAWSYKLYFSTDLTLNPQKILEQYKNRFQIEFLYRDAKQHTGLEDVQARSENKLHFHFNISLSTINIAKITHWLPIEKEKRPSFSMRNIKTMYHNELLLKRFINVFGIPPNKIKNNDKIRELINYGTIAA